MAQPTTSASSGAPASDLPARLAELARGHGVQDLYVFGSRAAEIAGRLRDGPITAVPSGDPDADADVDVGVRPRRGTPFRIRERVGLTLALEELLGVGRVDLVVLPEVGAFLALAVVSGELLYCADPTDQAEYELYVLRRAGDLEPFERERRELILREGAR